MMCRRLGAMLLLFMAVFSHAGAPTGSDEASIVLLCRGDCDAVALDSLRLRKLFLGLPVASDGDYLQAAINLSDPKLEAFFYQSVVAMSRKSFENKRLLYKLRFAATLPPQFYKLSAWQRYMQGQEAVISYAWAHDLSDLDAVTILQTLWQGEALEN